MRENTDGREGNLPVFLSKYVLKFRVPSIFAPKYLKDIGKCGMIKTSIFYIWKDEMT